MSKPLYEGQRPCDQITYRLPVVLATAVEAIGVNGSNEPIRTFKEDGVWYMECPIFAINPEYVKFKVTL